MHGGADELAGPSDLVDDAVARGFRMNEMNAGLLAKLAHSFGEKGVMRHEGAVDILFSVEVFGAVEEDAGIRDGEFRVQVQGGGGQGTPYEVDRPARDGFCRDRSITEAAAEDVESARGGQAFVEQGANADKYLVGSWLSLQWRIDETWPEVVVKGVPKVGVFTIAVEIHLWLQHNRVECYPDVGFVRNGGERHVLAV